MIDLNSTFTTNVMVIIHRKYRIKVTISKTISIDDPYGIFINVYWLNGKEKSQIKIEESKIGPARLKDFMDEFDFQIRDKYPEFLL